MGSRHMYDAEVGCHHGTSLPYRSRMTVSLYILATTSSTPSPFTSVTTGALGDMASASGHRPGSTDPSPRLAVIRLCGHGQYDITTSRPRPLPGVRSPSVGYPVPVLDRSGHPSIGVPSWSNAYTGPTAVPCASTSSCGSPSISPTSALMFGPAW